MIQRIQSLWFLLASVCAFLSIKLPFYIGTTIENIPSHQLNGKANITLLLLTILTGTLCFVTIFLFKKRKIQVRFGFVCILLELILLILYFLETANYVTGTYALSALLQAAVLFLLFLALRGISKDINIIKNSNRLR